MITITQVTHRIIVSVTSSILGFLTGITIDFRPSAPSVIACFATLAVVVGSLIILVVASYGPGPARIRPQWYLYPETAGISMYLAWVALKNLEVSSGRLNRWCQFPCSKFQGAYSYIIESVRTFSTSWRKLLRLTAIVRAIFHCMVLQLQLDYHAKIFWSQNSNSLSVNVSRYRNYLVRYNVFCVCSWSSIPSSTLPEAVSLLQGSPRGTYFE